MTDVLHILAEGEMAGELRYHRSSDKLSWHSNPDWRTSPEAFPASLSLPQSREEHSDEIVRNFLQGLLPDNPEVLTAWGKRFQVSPRNPFSLLSHIGEDCAGAIQFVRPERLEKIQSGSLDSLTRLSASDVADRIANLELQAQAIPTYHEGRFSLAGAQLKDALHWKKPHWYLPQGRHPSTHILKPELAHFDEHSINEHTCLTLAAECQLPTAKSEVLTFDEKAVISIKRYDRRINEDGTVRRVHQEDTCQALGIHPEKKYQSDGGPSAGQIIHLLREHSSNHPTDIDTFLRALALNWAILGTDAHAKNYSLLHAPGSFLRLAPLYDLASYLPYRDPKSRKIKMAMKYGHTYRVHEIDRQQWSHLASDAQLKPARVLSVVEEFLQRLLDSALDETHAKVAQNHSGPFLDQLIELIRSHTQTCLTTLRSTERTASL